MLVSCSYCGKIHEKNFDCGRKPKMRYRYSRDSEQSRFRNSAKWQKNREIREYDKFLWNI